MRKRPGRARERERERWKQINDVTKQSEECGPVIDVGGKGQGEWSGQQRKESRRTRDHSIKSAATRTAEKSSEQISVGNERSEKPLRPLQSTPPNLFISTSEPRRRPSGTKTITDGVRNL